MSIKKIDVGVWEVSVCLGLPEMDRFRRRYPERKIAERIDKQLESARYDGRKEIRRVLRKIRETKRGRSASEQRERRRIGLMKDLTAAYFDLYCRRRNRDTVTKESRLRTIDRFFGKMAVEAVEPLDVEEFIESRRGQVTDATINRDIAVLRHLFLWALERRLIERNPADHFRKLDERREVPQISEKNVDKVFAEIEEQYRLGVFLFIRETGCRKGEALNLLWEDIRLDLRLARARIAKHGRDRWLPLFDGAMQALERQVPAGPFVFVNPETGRRFSDVRSIWERARSKANNPRLKIKDLRTAFANRWKRRGVNPEDISVLMGHLHAATTRRHYLEDESADEISRLLRAVEGGR